MILQKYRDTFIAHLEKMEFVMDLELSQQRKLAREDAGKVIDSFIEHGYFIQLTMQTEKL